VTTVDTVLNLTWAVLCVSALAFQWWRERSVVHKDPRARLRRTLSIFVAVVALFPCISASDDRVRLLDLDSALTTHTAFAAAHTDNPLAMQLEELEHAQPTLAFVLILILCFFLMVRSEEFGFARSSARDSQSRAPPLAA
jgi:hypothetical protein